MVEIEIKTQLSIFDILIFAMRLAILIGMLFSLSFLGFWGVQFAYAGCVTGDDGWWFVLIQMVLKPVPQHVISFLELGLRLVEREWMRTDGML